MSYTEQLLLPVEPFVCTRSYLSGYTAGVNWTRNYTPGGPFVYSGNNEAMRLESETRHNSWRHGFDDGLARRKHRWTIHTTK